MEKKLVKKICLLGDNAVGKTSLVKKFVFDSFDDKYIATIGTKTTKKEMRINYMGKDINLTLMLWDILGQKEYRGIQKMSFEGTSGALLVCDVTRPDTLGSLEGYWAPELEKVAGNIPLVFLGNKSDLSDLAKLGVRELSEVAFAFDSPFYMVSAKTGTNIEHAFKALGLGLLAGKMRAPRSAAPSAGTLTTRQALDGIIVHFCANYGQGQEFAMAVMRKQSDAVGIDITNPRRDKILLLIDKLAEADAEFKSREETNRLKVERRAFVEKVPG